MATNPLARAWSLDTTLHPYADAHMAHITPGSSSRTSSPEAFKTFFLNNLLCNRFIDHAIAHLIAITPTSESSLRDTAIIPYYTIARKFNSAGISAAQAYGVTMPSFPDAAENWEDEYALDCNTLYKALEPYAVGPAGTLLEHIRDMLTPGKYHWSTLAAVISVEIDYYIDIMPKKQSATKTKGLESVLDNEEFLGCAKILREEIARVRAEAEKTGWREEEAKELETRNRSLAKALWGVGEE